MLFWEESSHETITVVSSAGDKRMDELLQIWLGHETLHSGRISFGY